MPNASDFSKREWVGVVPGAGGTISLPLGSTDAQGNVFRYLTIVAENVVDTGYKDHLFFSYNGTNTLTLVGF